MIARRMQGGISPVVLTAGAGWAGRIVTAAAQLLSIRLLTDMLGVEGYGGFAVITGLLGWFALADLGFGSALQNYISEQRVAGSDPRPTIIQAARLLTVTSLVLCGLFVLVASRAGPFLIAEYPGISREDATLGWLVFAVLATGTGAASILLRIYYAEHRGYIAHAITSAGAIGALLGLTILTHLPIENKFVWSILVFSAPGFLIPALGLTLFASRASKEFSTGAKLDRAVLGHLWRRSRTFLLFNGLAASVLYVDYVILSQTVSAREIATYAIVSRMFTFAFFAFNSILYAYWPVSAEMFHRGSFAGLRKVIFRSILFGTAIILIASSALYFLADPIVQVLAPGKQLTVTPVLIGIFALYWVVRVWCDTFSMLVQSADGARLLCFVVPVQAGVNALVSSYGASNYGLLGLMGGMVVSFLLTVAWALPLLLLHLINKKRASGGRRAAEA